MAKGPGGFSVGRVSIQVVPDTSTFREKLKAELAKEIKGLKVRVPVDVDAAKAVTQLKALDTILRRIDGRQVNIGANVDARGDLDAVAKKLSKVGSSASEAADGFGRMSRFALIAVAVILLLAPALAVIATLLAGLPALLFAFGGAALAVGLGIDGLKKAAQGFSPTIERLQKSLSANFERNLTKPFIELNKIAPVLDKGLNSIATSLSGIISDMIKFITSAEGMAQLNTLLQNTGKFFEQLRPAFEDGFKAFIKLASVASTEFGALANTFNRFAANFLAIVDSAAASGLLTSALRNLNIVLDALFDAFNAFFAAGLKAMTVLGGPLTTFIDGFTQAFVALMPILTAVSKFVLNVLGEALKQLAPIFEALTPFIQTLGDILGKLLVDALRALGPLLKIVATILNDVLLKALSAIAPFIPKFVEFFTQLAQIVGEFLVAAFTSLAPFLDVFLKFVTDLLIAITPLLPMLLQFATEVLRTMADVFKEIGPDLVTLGQDLFPKLLVIIKDLVPIVGEFLRALTDILPILTDLAVLILEVVIPVMQGLFTTVSEIWPLVVNVIRAALSYIQGYIDLFMGLITGNWDRAWTGLKQILESTWELIKSVIKLGVAAALEFVAALPLRILAALAGLPGDMVKSGRAMMQGLVDGIKSMAESVVKAALDVVNRVRNLLPFSPAKDGPFSGKGYTLYSGRALMEDWARGIEQGAPKAVQAVEDAMSATQTGMDVNAAIAAEGFGDLQGQIMSAMSGWEVVIDANGITKLVNKTNERNARR